MTENYLITSFKIKTSFIFLVCVALVGCIGKNNPKVEPFQPSSALTYDKPMALETNSSALVQAIVSNPAVSRALTSAAVARERVAISQTQKEITVSASGSSGFETEMCVSAFSKAFGFLFSRTAGMSFPLRFLISVCIRLYSFIIRLYLFVPPGMSFP